MKKTMMTPEKLKLLQSLQYDTHCTFGRSEVHGVGVFAIHDIKEGTDPFPPVRQKFAESIVNLTEEELDEFPDVVSSKIRDLFIKTGGHYPVYATGLNGTDIRFYVNHSEEPNIALNYNFGFVAIARVYSTTLYCPFKTLREIKKGEELFWDYRTTENADDIYKQYPFIKKDGLLKKAWKKLSK